MRGIIAAVVYRAVPLWAWNTTSMDAAPIRYDVKPLFMSNGMGSQPEPVGPLPGPPTIANRTLPFGTVVLVTNPASGRSTFARVTDRGPVSRSYLIELSAAAATALELDPNAARRVDVREVR